VKTVLTENSKLKYHSSLMFMWYSSATPSDSTTCRQTSSSSCDAHPLCAYDCLVELPVPRYVCILCCWVSRAAHCTFGTE